MAAAVNSYERSSFEATHHKFGRTQFADKKRCWDKGNPFQIKNYLCSFGSEIQIESADERCGKRERDWRPLNVVIFSTWSVWPIASALNSICVHSFAWFHESIVQFYICDAVAIEFIWCILLRRNTKLKKKTLLHSCNIEMETVFSISVGHYEQTQCIFFPRMVENERRNNENVNFYCSFYFRSWT